MKMRMVTATIVLLAFALAGCAGVSQSKIKPRPIPNFWVGLKSSGFPARVEAIENANGSVLNSVHSLSYGVWSVHLQRESTAYLDEDGIIPVSGDRIYIRPLLCENASTGATTECFMAFTRGDGFGAVSRCDIVVSGGDEARRGRNDLFDSIRMTCPESLKFK